MKKYHNKRINQIVSNYLTYVGKTIGKLTIRSNSNKTTPNYDNLSETEIKKIEKLIIVRNMKKKKEHLAKEKETEKLQEIDNKYNLNKILITNNFLSFNNNISKNNDDLTNKSDNNNNDTSKNGISNTRNMKNTNNSSKENKGIKDKLLDDIISNIIKNDQILSKKYSDNNADNDSSNNNTTSTSNTTTSSTSNTTSKAATPPTNKHNSYLSDLESTESLERITELTINNINKLTSVIKLYELNDTRIKSLKFLLAFYYLGIVQLLLVNSLYFFSFNLMFKAPVLSMTVVYITNFVCYLLCRISREVFKTVVLELKLDPKTMKLYLLSFPGMFPFRPKYMSFDVSDVVKHDSTENFIGGNYMFSVGKRMMGMKGLKGLKGLGSEGRGVGFSSSIYSIPKDGIVYQEKLFSYLFKKSNL